MLTEHIYLCAFRDCCADKKSPFFFFPTISPSPSKRASLDGACLPLPVPQCRMPKDPSCWGCSPTRTFSLGCPTTKMSKKKSSRFVAVHKSMQWAESCGDPLSIIQIAGGQMRESGIATAKSRSGRKILHWTQYLLSSPEIADRVSIACPTTDGGEYKLAARYGWKEVPWGAVWVSRSSKAPAGALQALRGALPAPSLQNLKNSLKPLC